MPIKVTGNVRAPAILAPDQNPPIPGLSIPRDFYWVLREPAPLAGMSWPEAAPWRQMANVGFQHIVCLAREDPGYCPAPLNLLAAVDLDDNAGGRPPRHSSRDETIIRRIVDMIVPTLRLGEGVVVHCVGGTGRTGTVVGCVLRALGYPQASVFAYFQRLNVARGRECPGHGWPESAWQRELVVRYGEDQRE